MYAEHRGLRLWYEVSGDPAAPAFLLLRGYGRTSEHSRALIDLLARQFRVVAMDNRGIGRSSAPLPPYSTRAMAGDAARVLDAAGIERAHVFGLSLGGMIAQRLAIDHPERVDRLVLGCTRSGGKGSPGPSARAAFGLLSTLALPVEAALRRSAPLVLSRAFLEANPAIVEEWCALAKSLPVRRRGLVGQLAAGALHDASRELHRIAAPTLVVTGDADLIMDVACSRELARRIPAARLALVPGAGHDFPTEDPAATVELLSGFLGARGLS